MVRSPECFLKWNSSSERTLNLLWRGGSRPCDAHRDRQLVPAPKALGRLRDPAHNFIWLRWTEYTTELLRWCRLLRSIRAISHLFESHPFLIHRPLLDRGVLVSNKRQGIQAGQVSHLAYQRGDGEVDGHHLPNCWPRVRGTLCFNHEHGKSLEREIRTCQMLNVARSLDSYVFYVSPA